jgi:hypothetical protein
MKNQILLALAATFAISTANAQSANTCEGIFAPQGLWARAKGATAKYVQEVKETKGKRLFAYEDKNTYRAGGFFILDEDPSAPNGFIYGALQEILESFQTLFGAVLKNDPDFRWQGYRNWKERQFGSADYQFSPINGIAQSLVYRPLGFVRNRKAPTMITSSLVTATLSTTIALTGYIGQQIVKAHTEAQYATQYLTMAKYDYRFYFTGEGLRSGKISEKDAIDAVHNQKFAIESLTLHHWQHPRIDLERDSKIATDTILFFNVRNYFLEGVQPQEGFVLHREPGPLTDGEKRDLITIEYNLYTQYALVSDFIYQTPDLAKEKENPAFAPILEDIQNNPYRIELEKLYHQGKINTSQYNFLTQQDYFQQSSFLAYKVLRIDFVDDNGHVITLSDARNEQMDQIHQGILP